MTSNFPMDRAEYLGTDRLQTWKSFADSSLGQAVFGLSTGCRCLSQVIVALSSSYRRSGE
jgi:hypothetical protein